MSGLMADDPPAQRDCLDCGEKSGMRLQNAANVASLLIPLLYICERCHASLTIPPPIPPFENVKP